MTSLRPEHADDGKPKCGAQKRQGGPGETCTFVAGWGTDHVGTGRCRLHGGNTRTQRAAAQAEKAEEEARRVLATLDVTPVADPFAALSTLAGQVLAWQEAISHIVNKLGDRVRYEGASGAEQLRAEVALYERAMDRTGQILGMIAKLNIEDRMARVTERQADALVSALEAALAAAGVTGTAADEARKAAARHLRAV
ncbi:hypothetical protein [Streptomyces scabiei]|uniref:hypothetical protein n=1 Tax=Streptomyces scabiei TaxID=1930 RepID=UPI001B327B96|nr:MULTISPECIES: hypothetical protein [Streptomyces]MBP5896324.1 hypothetical protein [Streptomyces sp. LBUM 1481]MDX3298660.1 hypothetical protein [Streptomyces scabiei]